jgi:hypothetical protein
MGSFRGGRSPPLTASLIILPNIWSSKSSLGILLNSVFDTRQPASDKENYFSRLYLENHVMIALLS